MPAALERLDRLVQERVLSDRVVRVKLWTRDGRIVYSDEPRLIGAVYARGEDEIEALRTGETHAELSDLSKPENRFERGEGRAVRGVHTRSHAERHAASLRDVPALERARLERARDLAALRRGARDSLLLLWLIQVPLAWRPRRPATVARRPIASSSWRRRSRRRSTSGAGSPPTCTTGPVQELAGLSYSLSAAAERSAPDVRSQLRDAAARARDAIRGLRAVLVEIHPPNLQNAGLESALRDLLAPLRGHGIATTLDVPEHLRMSPETELLLFRAGGEAIRNVQRHAAAREACTSGQDGDGVARIEVADDGAGFSPEELELRRAEGHVGLSLLEEVAASRGGRLELRSTEGGGTTFVLEVPDP